MHRPSVSARLWAAGPEEEAEKPEERIKAKPLGPEAGTFAQTGRWGLAEGARLFAIK